MRNEQHVASAKGGRIQSGEISQKYKNFTGQVLDSTTPRQMGLPSVSGSRSRFDGDNISQFKTSYKFTFMYKWNYFFYEMMINDVLSCVQ